MRSIVTLYTCVIAALIPTAWADIVPDSVFPAARQPASMLDIALDRAERDWMQHFILHPSGETRIDQHRITSTRTVIRLDYRGGRAIHVTAWINDLGGFLALNETHRRQLVADIRDAVKAGLLGTVWLDRDGDGASQNLFGNENITLAVMIADVKQDTKGRPVSVYLPDELGIGVAGYAKGRFHFHRDYYLLLKTRGNVAIEGDPNLFISVKDN